MSLEGNHTDIHEKLAECSLFVLTSEFEGLSNALIEAMMIGLPCISTDYPGADELISDGKNGKIVKRGDSTALAEIIIQMIEKKIDVERLTEQSASDAVAYKKENVLRRWHQVIEQKDAN